MLYQTNSYNQQIPGQKVKDNPIEEGVNPNYSPESNLPKNKKGAVDEWIAMERQKRRAIEELTKKQKEQEKIAKKEYK